MTETIRMLASRTAHPRGGFGELLELKEGQTYTLPTTYTVSLIRNGYARKLLQQDHHVLAREVHINPTAFNRCLMAMVERTANA